MRVHLERDRNLKELEEKVNRKLEELEENAYVIKGITYATHTIPKMKGKEIVDYDVFYSVMIAYME